MAQQPRRETAKNPEFSSDPLSKIRVTTREITLSRKSSRKHTRQHRPVERSDSSESDDPSDGHSSDASSVSTSRLFRGKMKESSKLPVFTGKENWAIWHSRFEAVAELCKWDNE